MNWFLYDRDLCHVVVKFDIGSEETQAVSSVDILGKYDKLNR